MGLRSSPLTRTRQQQAGPALQRCSCIEYGMGRWHDGTYEHTTAWAVGHHRSLAQDGGRHGPLCSGAPACTTAWAIGTTVPMSTRRHGPSVIAARAHETALGMARSAEVLVHPRWHGPLARWCLPVSTRRHGSSIIAARMHKTAVGTARSAAVPVHPAQPENHDTRREHMTALAVGHRRSHARDGGRHGSLCSGACAYNMAWAVGTTVAHEYTTVWAVGHRRSHARDGGRHSPLRSGVCAC